jgi:hypothetical protein
LFKRVKKIKIYYEYDNHVKKEINSVLTSTSTVRTKSTIIKDIWMCTNYLKMLDIIYNYIHSGWGFALFFFTFPSRDNERKPTYAVAFPCLHIVQLELCSLCLIFVMQHIYFHKKFFKKFFFLIFSCSIVINCFKEI